MSNFKLAYGNLADTAAITQGVWTPTRPQSNLLDYRVAKKARTIGAGASACVVRFTLPASTYVEAVALLGGNISVAAQYRYRIFSDSSFTTTAYDSGTLDVYPAGCMPNAQIPPGAPNAGTGKPTQAEADRFQRNVIHLLPQQVRYGQIEVIDTANPAGYIEFGRLFIGSVFTPAFNPQYGDASLRVTSRSDRVRSRDGTPYFTVQRPDFSIPFALKWLTKHEAMRLLDLQVLVDTYGDVIAIWDAGDIEYFWRRQVHGRLKELDPIEHPLFATYATAFQVEGTLA